MRDGQLRRRTRATSGSGGGFGAMKKAAADTTTSKGKKKSVPMAEDAEEAEDPSLSLSCPSFLSAVPYPYEVTLFFLALVVRLWRIDFPNSVVFDEVHFGGFVRDYAFTNRYFFDIHPPLGKLSLMWIGEALGYDASKCEYKDIHQGFAPDCSYTTLRFVSACFGAGLVPLTFSITRKLGASRLGAVVAALLLNFDMLNLIESRLILIDAQLMFYCGLSLWLALKWWERLNALNGKEMTWSEEHAWILGIGTTCASAVSIKFTALATPGMIAVESATGIFFLKDSVKMSSLLKIGGLIVAQFALWYVVHFSYLPLSGEHGDGFMPLEFQKTLINNTYYEPDAPSMNFPSTRFPYLLYELNREMIDASARIDSEHHWSSKHYQWVTNEKGVLYWHEPDKANPALHRRIYILGNPMVIWAILGTVVSFLVAGGLYLRYREAVPLTKRRSGLLAASCFCFCAYMCNMLPYLSVSRQAFVYHYMPALYYGEILFALMSEGLIPKAFRAVWFYSVLFVIISGFLYWCPWVYALPVTDDAYHARQWMSTWH